MKDEAKTGPSDSAVSPASLGRSFDHPQLPDISVGPCRKEQPKLQVFCLKRVSLVTLWMSQHKTISVAQPALPVC